MSEVKFYKFESPLFKGRHESYCWVGFGTEGGTYITTQHLSVQELLILAFDGFVTAWLDEMTFVRITDILTVIDESRHGVFLKAESNIKDSIEFNRITKG